MFTITTKIYPAKVLVFNALNAFDDNKEAETIWRDTNYREIHKKTNKAKLYEKACKECSTGKIVLTHAETYIWREALRHYKPKTEAEYKVYKAMFGMADNWLVTGKMY